jgi:Fe-S-cluster containining protein
MKKLDPAILRELDAFYARLPQIVCKGKCVQACGAIALTRFEADRIRLKMHRKIRFSSDVVCSFLEDGRCSVYSLRPFICRLFGLTMNLSCPHGCEPERWIGLREQTALLRELSDILGDDQIYATTPTGDLAPLGSMRIPDNPNRTDADLQRLDDTTRFLRVICAGRVRGVVPGDSQWVDLDAQNRERRGG